MVSPSQIADYNLCQRKWAFKTIAKVDVPQHPSAEMGTIVHAILEAWLRDATPPNVKPPRKGESKLDKAARIAARMIKHLPPPGTGVVERQFFLRSRRGHIYTGKIDWSGYFDAWPTVIDHKTTGDLNYAKTETSLHEDVQATIYALAGFAGFGVDSLVLFWNYGTTKGRDSQTRPVKSGFRLPVVAEKFECSIEPVVAEMLGHRYAKTSPYDLPANESACDAFGGCPHRNIRCNPTSERNPFSMTQGQQSMADRMSAFGPPPQAPQGFGAPQPQPGYGAPQPQQGFGVPQMPQAPQQGYGAPQPQQAQPMPQQGYGAPQMPQAPQQGYGSPQMPQAPQPQQMPQQGGFQAPAPPPGYAQPQQAPQGAYSAEQAPNPPESGIIAPAAPEGEGDDKGKRGRGRPAGSKNKELGPEQHVFLVGVQAALGRPDFNGSVDMLVQGGDLAVQAWKKRYAE
jgi:hypothetical protein